MFGYIEDICNKNNIPLKIIEESKALYSIISKTKISRGNNRDGIIAASLYFSCKLNGVPRSSKEISKIFNIKTTVVTKGCKKFQEILHMNKDYKTRIINSESLHASDLIDRLCNKLNIDNNYIKEVKEICNTATEMSSENTPTSISGAAIYYVIDKHNLNIQKKEVSEACGISDVTINKCFKKITDYINIKDK